MGHCDEPSLLVLSRVNRQLNTLALSRYFNPRIRSSTLCLPMELPMRVLRIVFWPQRTIKHIRYWPEHNRTYHQYISDLRDLTAFIQRTEKIVSLCVKSTNLSGDSAERNAQIHHEVWASLIAVAISKGCVDLSVNESNLFTNEQQLAFPKPSRGLNASVLRSKSGLFRRLCQASTSEKRRGTGLSRHVNGGVKPTLRWVQLDGSSFNNSPFVFHTILIQHATSITNLILWNLDIWEKSTLECVHFPALQSLNFRADNEVSPSGFIKFFHRHSRLGSLILHANFNEDQVQQLKQRPSSHSPPKFPNLRSLQVLPDDLEWLVPDFRQCPNLKYIVFEDTWFPQPSQDAIRSTLNNLHASASMTSPLDIEMWLPLCDTEWVSKLHPAASGGTSLCWSRVTNLVLWGTGTAPRLTIDPIPSVLIDWISNFPSLEHLEVYPLTRKVREELGKMLAVRCPKLTSEFSVFSRDGL